MPLHRSFAARVFKPTVAPAGLDPALTFRGVRKVATNHMVDDGLHPVIQHRLGRATARLSQELYANVSDAADHDAATRMGHETRKATDPVTQARCKTDLDVCE